MKLINLKKEERGKDTINFYHFTKGLKQGNAIKFSIYYDIGGMNYFQGCTEARGYYFSYAPVGKGDVWEEQQAFSGKKILLKETKRFSRKEFENCIVASQEFLDKNWEAIKRELLERSDEK
jgi:hypothetical protein